MNFEKKDHNQYTAKWKGKKVPNIDQRHDSGKLRKDMKNVMHEFMHQLNQKDKENKNVKWKFTKKYVPYKKKMNYTL